MTRSGREVSAERPTVSPRLRCWAHSEAGEAHLKQQYAKPYSMAFTTKPRTVASATLLVTMIAAAVAVPRLVGAQGPKLSFFDEGLGFVRKYRDAAACPHDDPHTASALGAVAPNALGAAVGFVVGSVAGIASTRSWMGALRGGIVGGSIGTAMGQLASASGAVDKLSDVDENPTELADKRDSALCEVVRRGDQVRTPVLVHLGKALNAECHVAPKDLARLDPAAVMAIQRCISGSDEAGRIAAKHLTALRAINHGTCRAAAYIVDTYNRKLLDQALRDHRTDVNELMYAECEDDEPKRDSAPTAAPRRPQLPRAGSTEYHM